MELRSAQVIRGGWSWLGKTQHEGDEVEAPAHLIERWAADGYIKPNKVEPPQAEAVSAPAPAPDQANTPEPEPKKARGRRKSRRATGE